MSDVPDRPNSAVAGLLRPLGFVQPAGLTLPIKIGFVVLMIVIVASTALGYRHTRLLHESQGVVAHTWGVIAQLRAVHATLVDAESGASGYAITGDEAHLAPHESANGAIEQRLYQLEQLTEEDAPQRARVDRLRQAVRARSVALGDVVDAARAGDMAGAARAVGTGEGRRLMDAVRRLISEMEEKELIILDERLAVASKSFDTAQTTGLIVGITALLLIGMVFHLVQRFDHLRERAARDAADAEERFRVTLSSIGDAVLVTGSRGRLTFLNEATVAVTGIGPERIGQGFDEVLEWVSESTGTAIENPATTAQRERGVVRTPPDTVIRLPDGVVRPIEATAASIRAQDGTDQGVVVVVRDVSERRQAQRDLERSTERFRSLVQAASQIVWTTRGDGAVEEDSPTWSQFTGQTLEGRRGEGWLDALHPDDRERVRVQWLECVREVRQFQVEYRLRTARGGYRWSIARAVPVLDERGKVREWVGMNHDIHARKEAEQEQRQESRRKDEFIALLAHELRNPLAPLRNGLEVLKNGEEPDTGRVVEIMDRQVEHLVRLVDDLLDVSRISQGKLSLRTERTDVRELLRQVCDVALPWIQHKDQHLTVTLPAEPLWVEGDPVRLAQVVSNLLNNASKYSDREASIWLAAQVEGAELRISVRDTGEGIAPEMLPRLWDLFLQGHLRTDRGEGGLGIGLTLVKRLVEMHGGTVEAISAGIGRGSEFVVRLPSAPAPRARSSGSDGKAPDAQAVAGSKALRVLVIDDNEDSAESLGMLLRLDGHDVRTVYRGEAGLDTAERFDPQLVLCDIRMPGMNGYEVARHLRRMPGSSAMLVALTGFGSSADRDLSQQAGFDHHLVKPVDSAHLADVLARVQRRG